MNEAITFSDVLIMPKFSTIESRKDIDLSFNKIGLSLELPIISANMDTVTNANLAIKMAENGAIGCLHRFQSIDSNVLEFETVFKDAGRQVICSIGVNEKELKRAEALYNVGCNHFIIDIAHGASLNAVNQVKRFRERLGKSPFLIVGNFATIDSVQIFLEHTGNITDGIKIGIGPSGVCTTRTQTGVGYPQFSAIKNISYFLKDTSIVIIADGGMNTPGDCAKALGAGADLLMSGRFFAGTNESPGELVDNNGRSYNILIDDWIIDEKKEKLFKKYRGSASKESYKIQEKIASHRSPEGESILVPFKGPVISVLQEIEGGLRSAFSYTNSRNLDEFHKNVEFVRVSNNTVIENGVRK